MTRLDRMFAEQARDDAALRRARDGYGERIRKALEACNRWIGPVQARLIEAWMRVEHPALDALSPEQFDAEVLVALDCVRHAPREASEALARSFGL